MLVAFPGLAAAQQKLQHVSSEKNTSGNSTFLDVQGLNGNPAAIIILDMDAQTAKANPHETGVWYNGSQWAIFNQDMAPMPAGITFTLYWKNPDANAFTARAANGMVQLDHPLLNQQPAASFRISQVWNPGGIGGVYNNAALTIAYDQSSGKWMVKNANGSAFPEGAALNIAIDGQGKADLAVRPGTIKPNPGLIQNNPPQKNDAAISKTDPNAIKNAPVITTPQNPVREIVADPGVLIEVARDANPGFEMGLLRWTATGTAFSNQPVEGSTVVTDRVLTRMQYSSGGIGGDYWKGLPYHIGHKDNYWIGTYEKGNGDAPTGTLTSSSMRAAKRYLTFLLGGGNDINKLYVELQVKKTDFEAAWGAGRRGLYGDTEDGYTRVGRVSPVQNSEELFRYYFDLDAELNKQYSGKTVRLCIVDNKSTGWGHINVDDFVFKDNLDDFLSLFRGGYSMLADKDKPVWGYFDSHTHPAADEAFGKKYYVGSSITPLSTTWSNQVCTDNHTWGRTLDGFTNTFDPHKFFDGGWPDMWGYPTFNGKMHQKYQVDLIRRAWEGGLKIMCALSINNMYLATRALGHGTNGEAADDESVMLRQTAVMKRMAADHASWMEIAYTPKDARRIILEGKLCVVLGVESDVFGNFKSPDCTWGDRGEDRPMVTITEADAEAKLERKLNEYYDLGLRQMLPLHYLSKPFGGTSVFNGATFLPQISFYDHVRVKTGVPDKVGFNLYEDFPTGAAFIGNTMTYAAYAARIRKQDEGAEISMVNADGLSPVGSILFRKLMQKGFLVDQEHASFQSKRDIFSLSSGFRNYPVMASHCGPLGLSYTWKLDAVRYNGSASEKFANFGTTTIRNVAHEMELNDESIDGIRNTEGVIGVFALLNNKRKYTGAWGDIPNDCPGSSKTVAQMFCYTLDKMNGRGVGLASDLSMVDAVSPRFGPHAAWAMTMEEGDWLKNETRTTYRIAQRNGVRYDVPRLNYHEEFYRHGQIDGLEEDVWKALGAWEAGAPVSAFGGRVQNLLKGLLATDVNQLERWNILLGAGAWEQSAMYCLKNNVHPSSLTIHDQGGRIETRLLYDRIFSQWLLWKAKDGNNEPLRRHITGNRYWDFNMDGLAHYGLMPDLLQDLKNIGFGALQLKPLFSSAEDYIRMWEKAETAKALIR